jgi:hypothetical protein
LRQWAALRPARCRLNHDDAPGLLDKDCTVFHQQRQANSTRIERSPQPVMGQNANPSETQPIPPWLASQVTVVTSTGDSISDFATSIAVA